MLLTCFPIFAATIPTVTLTLDDGNASEATQDPGSFTITRTDDGSLAEALIVRVAISGNTQRDIDYSRPVRLLPTQTHINAYAPDSSPALGNSYQPQGTLLALLGVGDLPRLKPCPLDTKRYNQTPVTKTISVVKSIVTRFNIFLSSL